jgi:hypothetical protein
MVGNQLEIGKSGRRNQRECSVKSEDAGKLGLDVLLARPFRDFQCYGRRRSPPDHGRNSQSQQSWYKQEFEACPIRITGKENNSKSDRTDDGPDLVQRLMNGEAPASPPLSWWRRKA